MPRFTYRAKDQALRVVEGTIEADDETTAISRLGREGVFPILIAEAGGASSSPLGTLARRVSPRTLAYMTHQLADLLSGGLPLLGALTLLAGQTEHPALRRVVESLAAAVRDGRAFSAALVDHPSVFPPLYISMVRAGEAGGALEQALTRLAQLGESEADLRSRLVSASVYPLFVLLFALTATTFLLTFVIPKLSTIFVESGQLLPWPTRVLLAVSGVVTRWWWAIPGALVLAGWAFVRWRATPAGRAALDQALMAVPGVRTLVRKLDTARFARTLGVMVSQGVPVLQSLEIVARNVSNTVLRRAVERIRESVRDGSSIAAALNASRAFPAFVGNMVAVGEESGTVDAALLKVASAYEREIDRAVRTLTAVLEPALLVLVGGILMFIVLGTLLPVFQVELVLQ